MCSSVVQKFAISIFLRKVVGILAEKKDLVFGQLASLIALFRKRGKSVRRIADRAVIQKEIEAFTATAWKSGEDQQLLMEKMT